MLQQFEEVIASHGSMRLISINRKPSTHILKSLGIPAFLVTRETTTTSSRCCRREMACLELEVVFMMSLANPLASMLFVVRYTKDFSLRNLLRPVIL